MILKLKNMQNEPVEIRYANKLIRIEGGKNIELVMESYKNCIEFLHCDLYDENNSKINKLMGFAIKSSILIVNSLCTIDNITDESAFIEIYNGVNEFKNEDFGYLFFYVKGIHCDCNVKSYYGINTEKVLRTYKLLCISDAFDFFPFTLIKAISRYSKIKKLCKGNTIMLKLNEYEKPPI